MENCRIKKEYNFLGASIRGVSHLKSGLPNQDSIEINEDKEKIYEKNDENSFIFYNNDKYSFNDKIILSLSDGHGSKECFRSEKGSKIAVFILNDILNEYMNREFDKSEGGLLILKNELENRLRFTLIKEWKEKILEDYFLNPLTDKEKENLKESKKEELSKYNTKNEIPREVEYIIYKIYGATILGVLLTNDFIFYIQLGDGDILTVFENDENDIEIYRPISKYENMIANETHSLCEENAIEELKTGFMFNMEKSPKLIMLTTDGYSNAFKNDEGFKKVSSDIWEMIKAEKEEEIRKEMINWLELASEKSGDDISIGLIYERIKGEKIE